MDSRSPDKTEKKENEGIRIPGPPSESSFQNHNSNLCPLNPYNLSQSVACARELSPLDGFLFDPPALSVNFTESPELCSTGPPQAFQIELLFDDDDDAWKDMEIEVPATVTSPEKAGEDPVSENSRVLIKPVTEGDGKWVSGAAEKNDEMPLYELPDLLPEFVDDLLDAYFESALGEQHDQHLMDQAATDFAPSVLSSEERGIPKCEKEMPVSLPGLHHHGTPDELQAEGMVQHGNCNHTPLQLNDISNGYNQTIEDQMPYDCKVTVVAVMATVPLRNTLVPSSVVGNLSAKLSELDQPEYQASMPASVSCKRGCTCKISECTLKCCTCYQANVGCFEACQYEGYQNSFGTAGQCFHIQTQPNSAQNKRSCRCKISRCTKRRCMCCKSGYGCTDECQCEGCQNFYGRRPPSNTSLMQ